MVMLSSSYVWRKPGRCVQAVGMELRRSYLPLEERDAMQ